MVDQVWDVFLPTWPTTGGPTHQWVIITLFNVYCHCDRFSSSRRRLLTFWRRNYFFLILAHPVYKMWIQEPNTLELWNKLHFKEEKTESISSSSSSLICQRTGPKLLAKRFLHIVRSRASSFNSQYPLLSLRSSSNFLRFFLVFLSLLYVPLFFLQ